MTTRHQKRMRTKRICRAFTLIELLVVLSLLTVALGLALPAYNRSLPNTRLQAAAREMAAMVRYARLQAKSEGTNCVLMLDMDRNTYGLENVKSRTLPSGIRMKVLDALKGEISGGNYSFVFTVEGGVEGGTIVVFHEKKSLTLEMDPIVGTVIINDENKIR